MFKTETFKKEFLYDQDRLVYSTMTPYLILVDL